MTSPDEQTPRVRVVVLNWNTAWLTARCLRSLLLTDYPPDRLEIVVVDNASIDGSLQRLRHDFPELRFIRNESNLGFAEGCNRALRDLDDVDLVALINNDSVVDSGWLRPLVDVLMAEPGVGAACPKILLETPFVDIAVPMPDITIAAVTVDTLDVTHKIVRHQLAADGVIAVPVPTSGRATVTIRLGDGTEHTTLVDGGATSRINSVGIGFTPQSEGVELRHGEPDDPTLPVEDVAGFSGGAVVLRVSALARVGLFDPAFFAYCEDLDLSWRLRRAGWRIVCVPTSVTHHLLHGSGAPTSGWFFVAYFRNWLLNVLRNGSPREIYLAYRNAAGRTASTWRKHGTDWLRVWLAVAAGVPAVVWSRVAHRPVGKAATDRVHTRFFATPLPRLAPLRVGGPRRVYVDVSHTLASRLTAGIQRVVRAMVAEVPLADPEIELLPVVWNDDRRAFRRVTCVEYADLLDPSHRQRRSALTVAVPPSTRTRVAGIARRLGAARLVDALGRRARRRSEPVEERVLGLERFDPGSVLFEVDATWNPVTAPRAELLPDLRDDGVEVVVMIQDLLPVDHPEWFPNDAVPRFLSMMSAEARVASVVMTTTESTAEAYRRWADPPADQRVEVVPLGVDSARDEGSAPDSIAGPRVPAALEGATFLLCVGTIEPRKNHGALLAAFDEVHANHPELHLVVVGREGWGASQTVDRLRRHASSDDHVHWFHQLDDAALAALYREAFAVVVPSMGEGFGLPLVEALAQGCVVISSNAPAMPEVGGAAAEYFDAADPHDLAGRIHRHLSDPDHHDAARSAAAGYRGRSWSEVAEQVAALLHQRSSDTSR